MKLYKFKGVCTLEGDYFLDILNKGNTTVKIRDMEINMVKYEKHIEISSIFQAANDPDAHSEFMEVMEILKSVIVFSTRRTPIFNKVNIYNLDNSEGYICVGCSVTVINSNQLLNLNDILDNMDIINQSIHLDNALHYYRLANLTDDNKESILNLYKCVESIIGFPKGNDKYFKKSLSKLKLDNYLEDFKSLRRLRNQFDSAHSAVGNKDGRNSHRDIKILDREVERGKELIQNLIESCINYLSSGNLIENIFISEKVQSQTISLGYQVTLQTEV